MNIYLVGLCDYLTEEFLKMGSLKDYIAEEFDNLDGCVTHLESSIVHL